MISSSTSAFSDAAKVASSKESASIRQENEELLFLDDLLPALLTKLPPPPIPPLVQIIPEGDRFFFTNSSREKLAKNEVDEKFIIDLHPETSTRAGKIMSNTIR